MAIDDDNLSFFLYLILISLLFSSGEKKNEEKEKENLLQIYRMWDGKKEVKGKKDAMSDFEKAGREDLSNQTKEEIAILQNYLPKQLTHDELKEKISTIISSVGATSMKDMGIVMKEAKAQIGTSADGKSINEVVKELLS